MNVTDKEIGAVEKRLQQCTYLLNSIDRKRSLRPSEKAMAKADYTAAIEALTGLLQKMREARKQMQRRTVSNILLHPFCNVCGWRKGGLHSWDGSACKCGHYEPPMHDIKDCGRPHPQQYCVCNACEAAVIAAAKEAAPRRQVRIVTHHGCHFVTYVERKKGTRYNAAQFDASYRSKNDVRQWIEEHGLELVEENKTMPLAVEVARDHFGSKEAK